MRETVLKIKKNTELEFLFWTKFEIFFLSVGIVAILLASYFAKDTFLALVAALFGFIYTVIAGKGKLSCYFFGIIGTLACALVSYKIALWGNFALHLFYYFPMEIAGFFNWRRHLKEKTREIIKTTLTKKEFVLISIFTILTFVLTYYIFIKMDDIAPLTDSLMTVLSITAMVLTVKRCVGQWVLWSIVNFLSVLMWFNIFAQGERTFSILFVRVIYFFIGIYFFIRWKKSMKEDEAKLI